MSLPIDIDKILNEVSLETNVPKTKVDTAFRSVFEMISHTMNEKKGDNILLPKFGRFVVTKGKLKKLNPEKYNEFYLTKQNKNGEKTQ